MTGRGMGYCSGNSVPGYMNAMPGRGWGMGRGRGRGGGRGLGWRHGWMATGFSGAPPVYGAAPYYAPPPREHEVQALKDQAGHLERTLDEIRKRLAEIEKTREEKS